MSKVLLSAVAMAAATGAQASFVTLYDQDFETPNDPPGFATSSYVDVSQQTVNSLYGGQPTGFSFAQSFTVETINLTGGAAFGSGYSDPDGRGETFALGMLSEVQDDLLGLSFDVGAFDFFNFQLDFSSLGLQGPGGPFANDFTPPAFRFRLYDNPSGVPGTGSGTLLDEATASGTASPIAVLDWTRSTFAFDARSDERQRDAPGRSAGRWLCRIRQPAHHGVRHAGGRAARRAPAPGAAAAGPERRGPRRARPPSLIPVVAVAYSAAAACAGRSPVST